MLARRSRVSTGDLCTHVQATGKKGQALSSATCPCPLVLSESLRPHPTPPPRRPPPAGRRRSRSFPTPVRPPLSSTWRGAPTETRSRLYGRTTPSAPTRAGTHRETAVPH